MLASGGSVPMAAGRAAASIWDAWAPQGTYAGGGPPDDHRGPGYSRIGTTISIATAPGGLNRWERLDRDLARVCGC